MEDRIMVESKSNQLKPCLKQDFENHERIKELSLLYLFLFPSNFGRALPNG